MSAICNECECELTYDGDCTWCQLVEVRKAADALADAVEAMWANRAWESTSAPEWKTLGDALNAYREATGSPSRPEAP